MPGGSFEATFRIIDEKSSRVIVDSIAWPCGGGVSGVGFHRFDPATDTEPLFSRSLVETIVMLHDGGGLDPPRNERDRSSRSGKRACNGSLGIRGLGVRTDRLKRMQNVTRCYPRSWQDGPKITLPLAVF